MDGCQRIVRVVLIYISSSLADRPRLLMQAFNWAYATKTVSVVTAPPKGSLRSYSSSSSRVAFCTTGFSCFTQPISIYILRRRSSLSSTRAKNPGEGFVRTANGPSSRTSSKHRRINALRIVWQRSSSTIHVVVYEDAHSLTTIISCHVRLITSVANVIPTALGGSHVDHSTTRWGTFRIDAHW